MHSAPKCQTFGIRITISEPPLSFLYVRKENHLDGESLYYSTTSPLTGVRIRVHLQYESRYGTGYFSKNYIVRNLYSYPYPYIIPRARERLVRLDSKQTKASRGKASKKSFTKDFLLESVLLDHAHAPTSPQHSQPSELNPASNPHRAYLVD